MSKNLTRKGLAFGALVALGASVIAGAPANAAGLADTSFVSLAPATGTDYAVIAGAGKTFTLAANEASTLSVGNIKFLVADASALINPAVSITLTTSHTVKIVASVVTITASNNLIAGQKVTFSGDVRSAAGLGLAAGTYTVATGDGTTAAGFALVETPVLGTLADAVLTSPPTVTVQGARALDNSYVVDSGSASSTTSSNLVLASDSEVTRSVTVTAWKDANTNNKIDDTEYASPARTVTFVKASELVSSTTLSPVVGNTSLTAKITTTPVLNGVQVLVSDPKAINAAFTRQDSTATLFNDATDPAVWDDTTKVFSVDMSTSAATGALANAGDVIAATGTFEVTATLGGTTDRWAGLLRPIVGTGATTVVATSVATTTLASHGLRVGDKVSFSAANPTVGAGAGTTTATTATVASVPSTSTFTWTSTLTTLASTASPYTVETWGSGLGVVDAVFAGAHTAQAYVNGVASGSKATAGTVAVAVDSATLSTTASASIGSVSATTTGANAAQIKTGTTSVPMVLTALDADEAAVTAGRPVVITAGALTDAASVGTFKINGLSSPQTLYTDAAGKVSFTVTETAGLATAQVRISAVVEGSETVGTDLRWNDAAYGLVDFNTVGSTVPLKRAILKGASYTLKLAVLDQWFQAPVDGLYRLKTSGSGVSEAFVAFVAGKADVKVTDSGVNSTSFSSIIDLQKATSGVFATVGGAYPVTVVTTLVAAPAVVLGASGSSLYGSAVTTTSAVAAKALVAIDHRTSFAATPAYENSVNLNGAVQSATTSQAIEGAVVSVSGAANLLFKSGEVEKLGSIELLSADANGRFGFQVYSTSAVTDSVITVTSNGVSKTIKVSFTGIGVGEGTALVVTAPATALPASTFQISAKLSDTYGNAVTATAGRVKVTHSGPGIVYGTLPTSTDANGALSFSVLLGAADVGNAVFTVSYDQNGDGDFVDAKDLTSAKTVVIGSASVLNMSASVAGIKGYVATTVRNASGKAVTVTVNGRVLTPRAPNVAAQLYRFRAKAGKTTVVVKVDGVTVSSRTVMVK